MSAPTLSLDGVPRYLPTEMLQEIVAYLLVSDCPIILKGNRESKFVQSLRDIPRKFPAVEALPSGYSLFYRYNTFRIYNTYIPAFLERRHNWTPFPATESITTTSPVDAAPGTATTVITSPRDHVTSLMISHRFRLYSANSLKLDTNLRALLSCPQLKSLKIHVVATFQNLFELADLFRSIKDTCLLLGEKVGEGNLVVKGDAYDEDFEWTMADFRQGYFDGEEEERDEDYDEAKDVEKDEEDENNGEE